MPKLLTITVEHSYAVKASLPEDRYENATAHHLEARTYDVSDLGEVAALEFANEKREELRAHLGGLAVKEYADIKGELEASEEGGGDA